MVVVVLHTPVERNFVVVGGRFVVVVVGGRFVGGRGRFVVGVLGCCVGGGVVVVVGEQRNLQCQKLYPPSQKIRRRKRKEKEKKSQTKIKS